MADKPRKKKDIETQLSDIQKNNLKNCANLAGLDLAEYERSAKKHLDALAKLSPDLFAMQNASAPDVEAVLKSLVKRSREASHGRDWVAYKPDPFGPIDVITDGPFQDLPPIPTPRRPVCRVVNTTILDTSANQLLEVDVVSGDESAVTHTESFDATPGVNEARFTAGVSGSQLLEFQDMLISAGFRFNFFPPEDGAYLIRPVAILNGAWQLLASGEPLFNTVAKIQVSFRTRAAQFPADEPPPYFYHDVELGNDSANGIDKTGSFFYQTATGDDSGTASGELLQGLQTHVVVQCVARITTLGPCAVFLDVDQPKLFLRVPEVHVDQLDCSGSVALTDPTDWQYLRQPPQDFPFRQGRRGSR